MERISILTSLTDDLAKLETQKRDVAFMHLCIINQEKALEESREKLEAAKGVLNATLDRIDAGFLCLYPAASPASVASATVEVIKEQRAEEKAADAEPPREKHPCHLCEDVFYSKVKLVKHLRSEHKVSLKEAVSPPVRSVCADCLNPECDSFESLAGPGVVSCVDHHTTPSEDQVKWRDSTCQEWRGCQFQNKCFGPANEEDPTCFKEDEVRRLGEKALTEQQALSTCPKCEGEGMYIEDGIEDGGGETYCDCAAGVALKEKDVTRVPIDALPCGLDYCDKETCEGCEDNPATSPETVTSAGEGWRDQRESIIKAAIAAGDDINEHGVFLNPEIITIPLPKKGGYSAEIRIAVNADGGFHFGYKFDRKEGSSCGGPSVTSTAYPTRVAAIGAAVMLLKRQWPEAWTETKLKSIRNAVAEFLETIETPTTPALNEEAKQEVAPAVGETAAQALETAQCLPLDEAIGDCDLCMGYGVVEGETALVPCTCPAGVKVKGGVVASCCDNCNIEDPDCASCHLPDMAADSPVEIEVDPVDPPKCANKSCTANDPNKKEVCLRIGTLGRAPQDCKSFVPAKEGTFTGKVDAEGIPWDQRIHVVPATIGADNKWFALQGVDPAEVSRIKAEWKSALSGSKVQETVAAAKAEPTALQKKCPHPKPFREETPNGLVCKVCKLVLEEQKKLF